VVRSDGTNGTVAVNYATGDKTATAGTHYASAQGTLTFNQGDMSKTFTVHAIDNATLDGNKTANLTLSSPTGGAALGSIATSTLTFIDDESAPSGTGSVQFTASTFTASRSANANALITVSRTGNPAVNVSVNYAVLDGTAIANGDYKATSGTLTFAPNETTKFFLVPLVKGTPHGESTASLLLTNVSGSTFGPQTTATLKLED
jgi:chitinase